MRVILMLKVSRISNEIFRSNIEKVRARIATRNKLHKIVVYFSRGTPNVVDFM